MRFVLVMVICLSSVTVLAQEKRLTADFRREKERVSESCDSFGLKLVTGCAYTLFTDHPLHIAAGSLPPQNGFGFGGAFVFDKNTHNWRMSWNLDGVASTSGSWRAGAYMKIVHSPDNLPTPEPASPNERSSTSPRKKKKVPFTHSYSVIHLYAETTSLNKINFFGLGNDSTLAGASVFGMTETVIGARAIKPVFELPALAKLNLSLLGEFNGRFVSIRDEQGQSVPSISQLYNGVTAPGLTSQPGFIQAAEGVRIKPGFGYFHLNYLGKFEQFAAPSRSQNSFLRWTVDLDNTYYLHGNTKTAPNDIPVKGPDECAVNGENCPEIPHTANLSGSVGVRLFVSESITSATSAVPFYFQQTLGGSDIDSSLSLGSYRDYRFRAPNLLLLRGSIEHSLWGPFGAKFMVDEGRVALTRSDLGFSHLKHSFAGGLTLRAGAFPMVSLMFAWGGPEGHHNIINMNTSLLGGASRPSLD